MTFNSDNSTSKHRKNSNANTTKYSHETNTNANSNSNNQNNQNSNDIKESINRSLDQTKDNINRSIDESRNQIPRYNEIVNSYQQQSLQTAKEISEEYIESQKAVINSLQSALRPYNESFNGLVTRYSSPEAIIKAYTQFVSNIADNAVSTIRLTNNIIFSNLDSMKSTMHQARDNAKHISNLNVNAARTLENNTRQMASAVLEVNQNNQNNNQNNNNNDSSANKTTYSATTTTTATTKKQ